MTLDQLLQEQSTLPAKRRAAQLAGDGETVIRLADREQQLAVLIATAQTHERAQRLRQEIADLEATIPALVNAETVARPAAQEALAALNDYPRQLQALRDQLATAQGTLSRATGTLDSHRRQIADRRAQLAKLYAPDSAPEPPAPRPAMVQTHEPLTAANMPPYLQAPPTEADRPNRSFYVRPDGSVVPNDGRPLPAAPAERRIQP